MRAAKGKSVNQSNDFGGSNAKAPSSSGSGGSKKTPFSPVTLLMWVLNLGLLVASFYALSNWTAINWMTGSYGWAALLEIGALLLLLFLFLAGICLFGWTSRVDSSFITLADSPQLLYLFAIAMPFLIITFFGSLALLSLTNINATNMFVATHAEAVFKQAASYSDNGGAGGITREAFIWHICSLQSFTDQCNWLDKSGSPDHYIFTLKKGLTNADLLKPEYSFYKELSAIFDDMVNWGTSPTNQFLTVADIYRGVQAALKPYKQKFGWSVLAITIICLLQFAYYGYKFLQYQKNAKKEMEKEQLPFMGP